MSLRHALVGLLAEEPASGWDLSHRFEELLGSVAAAKDRGDFGNSPQARSIRIAAEAGIRLTDALGSWATWARDVADTTLGPPQEPVDP
jgi:hypothetical protein